MSESSVADLPSLEPRTAGTGGAMLDRALGRARWSILWERLWPALASIATAVGLFLARLLARAVAVAAADRPRHRRWRVLPDRRGGAAAAVPRAAAEPQRQLRRLDRNSGLTHRPATTMSDRIAGDGDDSHAVALWRAHVERALRSAKITEGGPADAARCGARSDGAARRWCWCW